MKSCPSNYIIETEKKIIGIFVLTRIFGEMIIIIFAIIIIKIIMMMINLLGSIADRFNSEIFSLQSKD